MSLLGYRQGQFYTASLYFKGKFDWSRHRGYFEPMVCNIFDYDLGTNLPSWIQAISSIVFGFLIWWVSRRQMLIQEKQQLLQEQLANKRFDLRVASYVKSLTSAQRKVIIFNNGDVDALIYFIKVNTKEINLSEDPAKGKVSTTIKAHSSFEFNAEGLWDPEIEIQFPDWSWKKELKQVTTHDLIKIEKPNDKS